MTQPTGGRNLGVARAFIELVTSRFTDSTNVVMKSSMAASKAVDGIGAATERTEKRAVSSLGRVAQAFNNAEIAAKRFDKSPLGVIQTSLDKVKDKLVPISLAMGALSIAGVKAAQDLKSTQTSLELLTGSAEKAKKVQETARKLSDKFGTPYLEMLQGAKAFLPIVNETKVDLAELLKLSAKIKFLKPEKSFGDIKFAINEAISGDFVSIKDQLDLSREQRDELKKTLEENGPGALIAGINKILAKRNVTDDVVAQYGKSGALAFAQLKDEVTQLISEGFQPLLEKYVIPFVQKLTEMVRSMREGKSPLLAIGAGFAVALAAAAPLLGTITSIISVYKALTLAATAANIAMSASKVGGVSNAVGGVGKAGAAGGAGLAGKAGVTAVALEIGNRIGLGIVNIMATAGDKGGDLDRVRNGEAAGDVVGERLKQAIVIIVDLITKSLAETLISLIYGFNLVTSVLHLVINVLKFFGTFIQELVGTLEQTLGIFIMAIASLISKIPGLGELGNSIGQEGANVGNRGVERKTLAEKARIEAEAEIAKGLQVGNPEFLKQIEDIRNAQQGMTQSLVEMLFPTQEVAKEVENLGEATSDAAQVIGDSAEYLEKQAEEIADATQQYNDDVTQITDEGNKKRLDTEAKYQDTLIKIAEDYADDRANAQKKLEDTQNKGLLDLARDGQDMARKSQYDQIDAQTKFAREETIAAKEHAANLVQIRKDSKAREEELLTDMDFRGIFELRRQTTQQMEGANADFLSEREAQQVAFQQQAQDRQTAMGREREEKLIQFQRNLDDARAAYLVDVAEAEAQRKRKLVIAAKERIETLGLIAKQMQEELTLRAAAFRAQLTMLMMTEKQRVAIMMQAQQALIAQAYSLMSRMNPFAARTNPPKPRTGPGNNSGSSIRSSRTVTASAYGNNLRAGQMSTANELAGQQEKFLFGGKAIMLPQGAGVFTPMKDGRVDANGGGRGASNVTIHINGAGDPSTVAREVERRIRELML